MTWTFKQWYKENGPALNESRRAKYKVDKEYRERVLKYNKDSRARAKEKQDLEQTAKDNTNGKARRGKAGGSKGTRVLPASKKVTKPSRSTKRP